MNKWEKEVQKSLLDSEEAALKELEKQYRRALKEVSVKIRQFQTDIATLDEALSQAGLDDTMKTLLQSQKQSKIYQQQYQKALQQQIGSILDKMHSDNYTTVDKYLHECYEQGYVGTMYSLAQQGMPIIAPIDQAAEVKAILTDSKVSGSLYEALGVDAAKLKKTISQEISRGIATGMGYGEIARNISLISNAPLSRTKTIARTEGHRIQEASTFDAAGAAKQRGADLVKQWDASLDGRTRDSHRRVDGEIKELDEKFSNGLMYPGDPNGGAAEVVNCRCTMLTRARAALDESELEVLKERAAYFGLDKTENFEEYKRKYLKVAESKENLPSTVTPMSEIDRLNAEEKRLNGVVKDAETELAAYKEQLAENLKKADASSDFEEWMRLSIEEDKLRDNIRTVTQNISDAKAKIELIRKEKPWAIYADSYTKAQSPQEVAELLKQKGYFSTGKINMDGLSLDGAQTVATALERCFSEYPEMAGKIKGITISKRNQVGASFNGTTKMLEIGQEYFSGTIEEMRSKYEMMVKSGYAPNGCDYRGIIVHEFGHAVDDVMSGKALESSLLFSDYLTDQAGFKRSQVTYYADTVLQYVKENVSRYGSVSMQECFAECFNEYICSANPRKMATWYGERIDEFFWKAAKTLEKSGKSDIINVFPMNLQLFAEKDLAKQKTSSIKKSLTTFKQRIAEHQEKIANPEIYYPDWNEKDSRERKGLIKHWRKEISNFQRSIEDRIAELKKRGEYDE